jgi:lysophospholipid acyltransferase (LPLAT)-like uncharacterized protein
MDVLKWIKLNLLPPLGAGLIKFLGKCIRISSLGEEKIDELYQQGYQMIIVFWHGQQLMMPLAYRGKLAYILISRHRDGELIYRIVNQFGFRSVRGSTTRGGSLALRQLIRHGREGADLVVTPDGPKGPRQKVQDGVLSLAKLTGFPIVPLTFNCSKKKSFPVGIALWSLIPGVRGYLFGDVPFGWILRHHQLNWKPSVVS